MFSRCALQLNRNDIINVMKHAKWRGGEVHFCTSFRFIRTIKRGQHRTYADIRHFRGIPFTWTRHFISPCITRITLPYRSLRKNKLGTIKRSGNFLIKMRREREDATQLWHPGYRQTPFLVTDAKGIHKFIVLVENHLQVGHTSRPFSCITHGGEINCHKIKL